jgi:hypothetical protein
MIMATVRIVIRIRRKKRNGSKSGKKSRKIRRMRRIRRRRGSERRKRRKGRKGRGLLTYCLRPHAGRGVRGGLILPHKPMLHTIRHPFN